MFLHVLMMDAFLASLADNDLMSGINPQLQVTESFGKFEIRATQ
jgi:hypothetical protein